VLQLTRSAPALTWTDADLRRLRLEFDARHCIHLPSLLDVDDVRFVRGQIDRGVFREKIHDSIGVEECLAQNAGLHLLNFLANDGRFFRLVQRLTGCDPIGAFIGRIYRMIPGAGHYDSWHTDCVAHRMVGMSVNLSAGVYAGGVFQLRPRGSTGIPVEAPNTGAGDAIMFRIDPHIEHRVTAVEGTVAKTAFAGWFVSEPRFFDLLASASDNSLSAATAE
jgi:hypothetical protein